MRIGPEGSSHSRETRVAVSSRPEGVEGSGKRLRCAWIPPPCFQLQPGGARRSLAPRAPLAEDKRRPGSPGPHQSPRTPSMPARTVSSRLEAPRTGCAMVGAPPSYRDPLPQCRLALPTEGITFHPVHYLTRRPFAHWFHDQSHGRRGWCPRGTRSSDRERSPQPEAPSGGVGGRLQPPGVGDAERAAFVWRSRGWSVGGDRGGSGDGRGKALGSARSEPWRRPRLQPPPLSPGCASRGGFSSWLEPPPRVAGGEGRRRPAQRRSQLARSLAWRAGVEPPARRAARRK